MVDFLPIGIVANCKLLGNDSRASRKVPFIINLLEDNLRDMFLSGLYLSDQLLLLGMSSYYNFKNLRSLHFVRTLDLSFPAPAKKF